MRSEIEEDQEDNSDEGDSNEEEYRESDNSEDESRESDDGPRHLSSQRESHPTEADSDSETDWSLDPFADAGVCAALSQFALF